MAEELGKFADILENAQDFDSALQNLVCKAFTDHQRIIFNGNGYSQQWKDEAARRGLSNLATTADALPTYISQKNIDLVTRHGIFTESEFLARHQIHLQAYIKLMRIEAKTMVDMTLHQILPAAMRYSGDLAAVALRKKELGIPCEAETDLTKRISLCSNTLYSRCEKLAEDLKAIPNDSAEAVNYCRDVLATGMAAVRKDADLLEKLTDKTYWPYPTYSDMLYY